MGEGAGEVMRGAWCVMPDSGRHLARNGFWVKAALCCVWFIIGPTAFAKLGENQSAIETRYGKTLVASNFFGVKGSLFNFRGMTVVVLFIDGKSAGEILIASEKKQWGDEEALNLISGVGGEGNWQKIANQKKSETTWLNQEVVATRSRQGVAGDKLTVLSRPLMDRLGRDSKAQTPDATGDRSGPNTAPTRLEPVPRGLTEDQLVSRPVAKPALDEKKAASLRLLRWQMEQATNGAPHAQCSLGLRYLKGDGVAQDQTLARAWLQKAADQGNFEARAALQKLGRSAAQP